VSEAGERLLNAHIVKAEGDEPLFKPTTGYGVHEPRTDVAEANVGPRKFGVSLFREGHRD
jgi:hypothetical protein